MIKRHVFQWNISVLKEPLLNILVETDKEPQEKEFFPPHSFIFAKCFRILFTISAPTDNIR